MSPNVTDFLAALRPCVAGELFADDLSRALYSTDASMYQIMPHAVLIPKHTDDVLAAVEESARHGIPILPRGGGSSLAGQTVGAALVIDTTRWLDQVLRFDPNTGTVTVQPGVILDRLNSLLRDSGWMVGPDPASSNRATIGGMLGNNATGTHSILYGSVVDHVDSVRTILSDGSHVNLGPVAADSWIEKAQNANLFDAEARLIRDLDPIVRGNADIISRDTPKHWRRSGGYRLERLLIDSTSEGARPDGPLNLAHLLAGSEGTLGFASEITLNLVRRPAHSALGIVHFQSRIESLEAVPAILETGPSAIELFDRTGLEQCRRHIAFSRRLGFVEGDPDALLITEYFGESETELRSKLEGLTRLSLQDGIGYTVVPIYDAREIENVWEVRKGALGLILGVKGDHKPLAFIEDAAVPPDHLSDYIRAVEAVLEETGTRSAIYAHASAGCLHVRPFINTKDAAEVSKMAHIAEASMELAKRFGGALSSEHGEGLARGSLARSFYGTDLYELYRRTKAAFDPAGLMNPGKVVDAPPMTENLRVGPDFRITTLPVLDRGGVVSNLDFSTDRGLDRSVELCTGIGSCRKLDAGSMCPSFMVTRDEKHSTRGRANALRSAMEGRLGPDGMSSEALRDAMSLCISCKACKNECPSNVDMARIKLEWQDQYWKKHPMPRRERSVAFMPEAARRWSGSTAPFVNAAISLASIGGLAQRALGIAPKRKLPRFARTTLDTWFAARGDREPTTANASPGRPVVLFADTFIRFQDVQLGIDAVHLLEGLGYEVSLSGDICCGRTLMSKGLVDESRRRAEAVVAALFPIALAGTQIVGLEPSCILSIRDEYSALIPGDPRVDLVAEHALTLEEFIAEEAERGHIDRSQFQSNTVRAVVHGHCHQKALAGMDSTRIALELAGIEAQILDSGCCGMAGSFGYEAEHFDWSIKMAERVLAPAVRSAPAESVIIAAGTSCRAQIKDTTGRTPVHPAQALLTRISRRS